MKNITIKIQYKWSYYQFAFFAFLTILMIVLPLIFFETPPDQIIIKYIWITLFSLLFIIFIVLIFNYYQTAIISENGIEINCVLNKIKTIYWPEIKRIQIEKLATGTAGMSIIYKEWIVIYTEIDQTRSHGGINKKKKGPWYICPTEKNIEVIICFAEKYNPDAIINL